MATSTTNNNYVRRTNISSLSSPNGIKTSTTYLNTTQLYITQPSSRDSPPPPPPRYPLHPPAIPPRNSSTGYQKNSITIPDFNSSMTPTAVYRSPAMPLTIKTNDHRSLEITDGSTIKEYFGRI
jgi:hypothetical protein